MMILGLHFGHDAAISIIKDGQVLLCVEIERINRVKHAISIHPLDIKKCLDDRGFSIDEIDYCTLTSTQDFEYVFLNYDLLNITLDLHKKHTLPCTLTDKLHYTPERMLAMGSGSFQKIFESSEHRFHQYSKLLPGGAEIIKNPQNLFPSIEQFITNDIWTTRKRLDVIGKSSYDQFFNNDIRFGFHYPATLNLFGKKIPSYLFSHHCAHASYTYYESPYDDSAILSHDGGENNGYEGGFFAYGQENKLYLYSPHYLSIGDIYTEAGSSVGFGVVEGPGKLMGLAAYGEPKFFDSKFVGNYYDIGQLPIHAWTDHCIKKAKEMKYDISSLGNVNKILDPINIDIAASTQKLLEETMLKAVHTLRNSLEKSNITTKHLCLAGGVALNCPSNTRIANQKIFDTLFVPPAVSDSGLAIGSALALYYNVMDHKRCTDTKIITPLKAYCGLRTNSSHSIIMQAFDKYQDQIIISECQDVAQEAAEYLYQNKIIGWFQDVSELGPRALGHRSILANPTYEDNWQKVNAAKKRELWRPFAPAVLQSDADKFFTNLPLPSYYMLINGEVIDNTLIPAVTHVDKSARVQCVNQDCGEFYRLLKKFDQLTGIPIVLNTSFNGPGEPIVETPMEAIEFLLKNNDIHTVFIQNYKVTKNEKRL